MKKVFKTANKWVISILELKNGKKRYKVTRRMPELRVSETRLFEDKEMAVAQFNEWLNQ